MEWCYPHEGPHFGGLWEAAEKSFKSHLRRVVGDVKLMFEELNFYSSDANRSLHEQYVTLSVSGDGIEVLTPGHFLV